MGALLDRNGLRPARYYLTADHHLYLSSEVGVNDFQVGDIVKKVPSISFYFQEQLVWKSINMHLLEKN